MQWFDLSTGALHAMAPEFQLQAAGGEVITRAQFRQYQHLILLFLPAPAAPGAAVLLREFAALSGDFADASARIFALSDGPLPGTPPLPLLLDPDGSVRHSYRLLFPPGSRPAEDEPFIIVLDRYGAPAYAVRDLHAGEDLAAEALSRAWGLEYECPE